MTKVGERSVRSDKKRDVKITVHTELKEMIYKLAYITDTTVMHLVEDMVIYAIGSKRILGEYSPCIVRDIRIDNALYVGHKDAERVGKSPSGINYVRVKTRLTEQEFTKLSSIAYGLDVRPARAAAILVDEAVHDEYFVDRYAKRYLTKNISDEQLMELKKIIEYISRDVEYNVSWANLLSYIIREVTDPVIEIKDKVNSFIVKSWRD
ncbi:hypothetical protein [Viridibacillus sp. FSL H8-0123]|uniref:hypothetical protein n=1 Tax=Viridibacillus sp. FSL H8-0123 TaxID=1928922 RepID=UPI00096BD328|nr:hypothetical protein [Viridibacillus sp. FSL H8-0123]OMC80920.1 hypothetical protein BK130_16490 [Viridibacillus sp. FSL H8-0123]